MHILRFLFEQSKPFLLYQIFQKSLDQKTKKRKNGSR